MEKNFDEESSIESAQDTNTELDWDGPEDLDNPRNWPQWQRVFNTTVPALQCLVM